MTGPLLETPVLHGYTLADVNHMARAAVVADRLMAMPVDERFDIAWSAIAHQLCEADEPPARQQLIQAGWQAISRHVRDGLRQRGYSDGRDRSDGPTMPRFAMFWGVGVTPSHEDTVVDRIGMGQAVQLLRGPYLDAILALATHGDYRAAADALGIQYSNLTVRLTAARRCIDAAWFGDETPPRRRPDRRVESYSTPLADACSKGHPYTPENTRIRHRMVRGKPNRSRVCRKCESGRHRPSLPEEAKPE